MTQSVREAEQRIADLIKQDSSAWEWAGRVEALLFNQSDIEDRFSIAVELRSYKESIILKLAEEAEQEAREKLNGPLVDYDYGIAAQHATAWLREKAR